MSPAPRRARGPFRADQLRSGDPYELSDGHAIYVPPAGGRHAQATVRGARVLATDPDVSEAGMDTGYSPEPGTLRAPDIAIGNVPAEPGWVKGAGMTAERAAAALQLEEAFVRSAIDRQG